MGIAEEVYFYDAYNAGDSGLLESHAPIIGNAWVNNVTTTAEIVSSKAVVSSGFAFASYRSATPAANNKFAERKIRFEVTAEPAQILFGAIGNSGIAQGWFAKWGFSASINDDIEIRYESSFTLRTQDHGHSFGPGIHEIRIVGEESVITAYFDGVGLRVTDILPGFQDYDDIGFYISPEIKIIEVFGRNGKADDYTLYFDTDFGPVGGPSGSSGGGGGAGGSPNPGSGNPSNIPCDPNTTLIINNGQVVSVAPSNPCQWTGLIWWKLICGTILTTPDYADEVEVYFNTLSDSFMSIGPISRLNESNGAHYFLTIWNDSIVIGKKLSAGVDDTLLAFKLKTWIPGTWYRLRLEIQGNMLRGYVNDVLELTTTDPNSSISGAGCAGIRLSRSDPATDLRFDNFRVWLFVYRPEFTEIPRLADTLTISRDDGVGNKTITVEDLLLGGESQALLFPKTIHINEGGIFTDIASQLQKIQDSLTGIDTVASLSVQINFTELFKTLEQYNFNMLIPIVDVHTFTDEEKTVHGITDTMTVQEFLSQFLMTTRLDAARMGDFVEITRTESVSEGTDPDAIFKIDLDLWKVI